MNRINIWPQNTLSKELIEKLLSFYKKQIPVDQYYGGIDFKGEPPQYEDLPEFYDLLESLGYVFEDNYCHNGNFFETNENYGIHVDTGRAPWNHSLTATSFLIPLYMEPKCHSYLFFLNQTWNGEATTFVRQEWLKGWNHLCSDYSDARLMNLDFENWDDRLNHIIPHLASDTREGMSIASMFKWNIGSFVSFPSNQLHFTAIDSKIRKIGLSIRLECKH